MARLTNYIPILKTTFTPISTITAGAPVGFDGALAADDAHIMGIAIETCGVASSTNDTAATAMVIGECDVTVAGTIVAGAYLKVASGAFATASAADLAAGKVVGKAKTGRTGAGTVTAFIGII